MASTTQKKLFFESEEGVWLRDELTRMAKSASYNTRSTYTATSSDELLFVDKHMNYMSNYPGINHRQYISNLKLKTKTSSR
jgi:hypothetical protein